MSHEAALRTCQTPCRSGLPSAVRGGLYAGALSARTCAQTGAGATELTTAMTSKEMNCLMVPRSIRPCTGTVKEQRRLHADRGELPAGEHHRHRSVEPGRRPQQDPSPFAPDAEACEVERDEQVVGEHRTRRRASCLAARPARQA